MTFGRSGERGARITTNEPAALIGHPDLSHLLDRVFRH
jgi:hypothetical protein